MKNKHKNKIFLSVMAFCIGVTSAFARPPHCDSNRIKRKTLRFSHTHCVERIEKHSAQVANTACRHSLPEAFEDARNFDRKQGSVCMFLPNNSTVRQRREFAVNLQDTALEKAFEEMANCGKDDTGCMEKALKKMSALRRAPALKSP